MPDWVACITSVTRDSLASAWEQSGWEKLSLLQGTFHPFPEAFFMIFVYKTFNGGYLKKNGLLTSPHLFFFFFKKAMFPSSHFL